MMIQITQMSPLNLVPSNNSTNNDIDDGNNTNPKTKAKKSSGKPKRDRTRKNSKKISNSSSNNNNIKSINQNDNSKQCDNNNQKSYNNNKNSRKNSKTHNCPQSNTITNYFPIVSRRLLSVKLKEQEFNNKIIDCIERKIDPKETLTVTNFEDKGKGIIAATLIRKGSFICEYSGDLIDLETAKEREKEYEIEKAGCYMYYFDWNNTTWCVDATKPTGRLGRLINHSRKTPNCKTRIFEHKNEPHLIFVALRDIEIDEEILYDYGERDRSAIKSNRWLTAT